MKRLKNMATRAETKKMLRELLTQVKISLLMMVDKPDFKVLVRATLADVMEGSVPAPEVASRP
jgi:hypothetical protein